MSTDRPRTENAPQPAATDTDRIEKKILLRAPLERVWRAVSDAAELGRWFGVALDGPFVAGARVTGRIRPTEVDADVAKAQEPYAGKPFELVVDRIEPRRLFSFLWHPYAVEPGVDYAREPMTRVTFELEETAEGTLLTISESGFDRIPLARRAKAFAMNAEGWAMQARLVEKYLEGHAR